MAKNYTNKSQLRNVSILKAPPQLKSQVDYLWNLFWSGGSNTVGKYFSSEEIEELMELKKILAA